jgi:hypothetical protein
MQFPREGAVPLFRLYHTGVADHFYTTSTSERDQAIAVLGYSSEPPVGYVFETQEPGTKPFFRLVKKVD